MNSSQTKNYNVAEESVFLLLKKGKHFPFFYTLSAPFTALKLFLQKLILPVVKLGTLALKTFCKPVANRLKKEAGLHPKFRHFIINMAQVFFFSFLYIFKLFALWVLSKNLFLLMAYLFFSNL